MSDENHGCRCVCHSFPDHGKLQDALEALRWHQEKLASLPASASPQAKGEDSAVCLDCGRDYNDFGMDVLLPRWQWLLIHPDEGGLLCANCIVTRSAKVPGAVGLHATIGIAPKDGTL